MHRLDLALQFRHLPLELPEVREQPIKQLPQNSRQTVRAIFQDRRQALGDVPDALRQGNPEFMKEPANLICLRRSCLDQSRSCSMQVSSDIRN